MIWYAPAAPAGSGPASLTRAWPRPRSCCGQPGPAAAPRARSSSPDCTAVWPPNSTRPPQAARSAGVAAGTAVAGAAIDHGLTGLIAAPAADSTLTPQPGTWLTVAASADLPDGTVRPFSAGAISGFLERVNGRARAVSGICTHQGCKLALAGQPARLVCPCHGAAFALDGAVLTHRLPGSLSPLPRLAVRETGGTVQVYAPAATKSSPGQP